MGRPVEKSGHDAAAHREAAKRWYRKLSSTARRDYVRRRDQDAQREADNRRYAKDQPKRDAARAKREEAPERTRARAVAQRSPIGRACENCGARLNLERHHPDYKVPQKTITLCSKCHSRREQSYKGVRKS